MRYIEITAGDDVTLLQTLKKNGVTFNMAAATAVVSRLLRADTRAALLDATSQANTGGANWAASLVEHIFTSAATSPITYAGPAILETQVTLSGKKTTWFSTNLQIVQGTIP